MSKDIHQPNSRQPEANEPSIQMSVPAQEEGPPPIQILDPVQELSKRFDRFSYFFVGVALISFLTLFFMVVALLIEAWRFNSIQYQTYQQNRREVTTDIINKQTTLINSFEDVKRELRELKDSRLQSQSTEYTMDKQKRQSSEKKTTTSTEQGSQPASKSSQ